MSILEKVKQTEKKKARRTLLYGVQGIGKSSWAAKWPNPVFIDIEDGLSDLGVMSFPKCETLLDAWTPIIEMGSTEIKNHSFETLVIDSVDWLEKLIYKQVLKDSGGNFETIADIPYGKGYDKATEYFEKLILALNNVIANGINVLLLAHCSIKRFESPEMESYDRYAPKLHVNSKGYGVGSLVQEFCDEVLFCNFKVYNKTTDEGFNRKRNLAKGTGERIIYTTERPSHLAKNRLGLPEEIAMSKDGFEYGEFISG